MAVIHTARSVRRYRDLDDYARWLRMLATKRGLAPDVVGPPSQVAARVEPAVAYVNHGRWVADCPTVHADPFGGTRRRCGGAMLVTPGEPYLCGECFNAELSGQWRPVVWPPQAAAIEDVLRRRPHELTRNWLPGETVSELRLQNLEHGVPF